MENTFYDISKMSGFTSDNFMGSNNVHKELIESFEDPRLAGLQGLIDYILSNGGVRYSPSIDVTEFFRTGEEFKVGYGLVEDCIGPSLVHRLSKEIPEGLNGLMESYDEILNGNKMNVSLLNILNSLGNIGMPDSNQLLIETFMEPDKNSSRFYDKKVIVSGSDTGIGRSTALEFIRRGADVAVHYPTEEFSRGANSVVDLANSYGMKARAFKGDFRKLEGITKFADEAIGYLEGIDILINNAGITLNRGFEKTSFDDFNKIVNVNFGGAYFLTQKVVPYMKGQGSGNVVNLSSVHALFGMAGHSIYAATKGAVIGLTQELAIELAPKKIRVNAIAPGWVVNANHFRLMPELDFGKIGEEETIARFISNTRNFSNHILLLASDEANYINGQTIVIDGGKSAGMYGGIGPTNLGNAAFGERYM